MKRTQQWHDNHMEKGVMGNRQGKLRQRADKDADDERELELEVVTTRKDRKETPNQNNVSTPRSHNVYRSILVKNQTLQADEAAGRHRAPGWGSGKAGQGQPGRAG